MVSGQALGNQMTAWLKVGKLMVSQKLLTALQFSMNQTIHYHFERVTSPSPDPQIVLPAV